MVVARLPDGIVDWDVLPCGWMLVNSNGYVEGRGGGIDGPFYSFQPGDVFLEPRDRAMKEVVAQLSASLDACQNSRQDQGCMVHFPNELLGDASTRSCCWQLRIRPHAAGEDVGFAIVWLPISHETKIVAAQEAEQGKSESLHCVGSRSRFMLDASGDAIFMIDPESGTVWDLNQTACTWMGEAPKHCLGMLFTDFFHPQGRPRGGHEPWETSKGWDALVLELRLGEPQVFEARLKSGDPCGIDVEIHAVLSSFADRPHILASCRDIRSRRRMQQTLVESERMASVGLLAAGVAHELNNPLSYVLANLDFVHEAIHDGPLAAEDWEELYEVVDDARDGAARMRDIVRDLRTFSRSDVEAGRRTIEIDEALDVALGMARNLIKYRAEVVHKRNAKACVLANLGQMAQVFLNLLVNACDALAEGSVDGNCIRIEVDAHNKRVIVDLYDTGKGIPEALRSEIFSPFVTTKDPSCGPGLGLSVARNLVQAHGGDLRLVSGISGQTHFRLEMPRVASEANLNMPSTSLEKIVERRGRVLIVDDEQALIDAVGRELKQECDVVCVTSGDEAYAILQDDRRFDLVLCDVLMPRMSGMELHRLLHDDSPEILKRLVYMTAGAFTPESEVFLRDKMHLKKPFSGDAVRALVRHCMHDQGSIFMGQ